MLFNSQLFLFAFLPVAALVFWMLGRRSPTAALTWLSLASLGFYAWWRPVNVLIILPSIAVNYFLARAIQRATADDSRPGAARWLLVAGIVFNILFLGYFKYTNFVATIANDVFRADMVLTQIILPLGISFITFQKIGFLMDVHGGRVRDFTFREYLLFVLFFPQLIAGPIVHFRELMGQFRSADCRFDRTAVASGLSLFVIGLFKKAVLADSIAPHVAQVFEHVSAGGTISLVPALLAGLGFTLQIYFDFSGYSEMALGVARLFGVRLPANFDSPLQSRSMIEYWQRWHITLSRFLTAYIYNPLVLTLTRRLRAAGIAVTGGKKMALRTFVQLVAFPTIVTMLVSGIWHGAGYTFVIWGLLHGVFLVINHAWRRRTAVAATPPSRLAAMASFLVTFVAVVVTMVWFRAPDVHTALQVTASMFGLHGIGAPAALFAKLGPLQQLLAMTGGSAESWWSASDLFAFALLVAELLAIALLLPSSLTLLRDYEPSLTPNTPSSLRWPWSDALRWRPTLPWLAVISVMAVASVMKLGGPSEFLYWRF